MDIKDRISKILALAESPNENEARAALLKARELMAKYKLQPEDLEKKKGSKVVRKLTGLTCTQMTDSWMLTLSAIIAENYCCRAYSSRGAGKKTYIMGFVGFEEDVAVVEKIYRYAVDCVRQQASQALTQHFAASGKKARELKNAYGFGFCRGVKSAFVKQGQEHQEWGLVLVTPPEVDEAMLEMKRPTPVKADFSSREKRMMEGRGFADGQKFDPSTKLEGSA